MSGGLRCRVLISPTASAMNQISRIKLCLHEEKGWKIINDYGNMNKLIIKLLR
jgi:hypothetical protein